MSRFVSLVEGRGDSQPLFRTVIASRLNARGGPGVQFDTLGVFLAGTRLEVLYDSPGPWAQVKGALEGGGAVTAWVSDQYLA
jgi:uncharacterized protein YgiM (DUF1202 family)